MGWLIALVCGEFACSSPPSAERTGQARAPDPSPRSAPIAAPNASAASTPAERDDPLFREPFVDVDEWREVPVRHRYVHGGFTNTATRFSFYFPPDGQYQGRFFQHITPVPDSENLGQRDPPGEANKIGFAIASGAYFIETNGGGKVDLGKPDPYADPTVSAYRANAAAARHSRLVAARIYQRPHRPYGYAYGGSGGGYRTIGSIENTTGVWDGVVPYVIGSTMALPSVFSVRMHAMRVLHRKMPQIVDAMEPGGSGDPYAGLNDEEQEALREVTRMGFPPGSWFGHRTMGVHGFAAIYEGVLAADPTYFRDFWTVPGYLGASPPPSLVAARVQHRTTLAGAIGTREAARLGIVAPASDGGVDHAFASSTTVAFRLASRPPAVDFMGGDLVIESGRAAGKRLTLKELRGDVAVLGITDQDIIARLASGDTVRVDNSNFLAMQTYHRHQVPDASFHAWDQFRDAQGSPVHPQRSMLLGPMFVQSTAGSLQTGRFSGKMIVVASLWDREAYPWQADWYRGRVAEHLGAHLDDHFRLWFTEHALHGDESSPEDASRTVGYLGVLQQALRDLSAWVETGTAPPASTQYRVVDGQVVVPPGAFDRKGVQPVITLKANGEPVVRVLPGASVLLTATAEMPPGAGKVVSAKWDMEGTGRYSVPATITTSPSGRLTIESTFTFHTRGTYFPAIQISAQREGNVQTPYAQPRNLARARVVVR